MKRDFSQPFSHTYTSVYFIVEDEVSGRFVVFTSFADRDEYGEEDSYRPLHTYLDKSQDTAQQIAEFLYENGFALNAFRELARTTEVGFSFVDDTPGNQEDRLVMHVGVDIVDRDDFDRGEARLVPLGEYAKCMVGTLFGRAIIDTGIAILINERFILGYDEQG